MLLRKPHLGPTLKNEEELTRQGIKGRVSSQREEHVQRPCGGKARGENKI